MYKIKLSFLVLISPVVAFLSKFLSGLPDLFAPFFLTKLAGNANICLFSKPHLQPAIPSGW
jgi:hypothetical protein